MTPRVEVAREQMVFLQASRRGGRVERDVGPSVVAVQDVVEAVGPPQDRVGPMLPDLPCGRPDQAHPVGLVVAVRIGQAVEPRAVRAFAVDQQIPGADVVHPVCRLDLVTEDLDRLVLTIPVPIDEEPDAGPLDAERRPAEMVEGHVDDRAHELPGRCLLDREPGRGDEAIFGHSDTAGPRSIKIRNQQLAALLLGAGKGTAGAREACDREQTDQVAGARGSSGRDLTAFHAGSLLQFFFVLFQALATPGRPLAALRPTA